MPTRKFQNLARSISQNDLVPGDAVDFCYRFNECVGVLIRVSPNQFKSLRHSFQRVGRCP